MRVQHLDDTAAGEGALLITGLVPHADYHLIITYPSHDPKAVAEIADHDALPPSQRLALAENVAAARARIREQHYAFAADAHGMKVMTYEILEDGDVRVAVTPAPKAEQHPSVRARVKRSAAPRIVVKP